MKKCISILLSLVMLFSLLPVSAFAEAQYSDTTGSWAEAAITRWSEYGIIEGYDGEFHPEGTLTRAQMAAILSRLLALPEADSAGFSDVKRTEWFAPYIDRCFAAGIMLGSYGKAMPNAPITREQAIVMLARAFGMTPVENPDLSGYTDEADVSDWAKGYVAAMAQAGIIKGTTDTTVSPKANIDRASTVTILDRAIGTYVNTEGAEVEAAETGLILIAANQVKVTGAVPGTVIIVSAAAADVTVNGVAIPAGTSAIAAEEKSESEETQNQGGNTSGNNGNQGGNTSGETGGNNDNPGGYIPPAQVATTSLTVSAPAASLLAGSGYGALQITRNAGANDAVTWESSDSSIVTVDADGSLHALQAGSVTIFAEANNVVGSAAVYVVNPTAAEYTITESGTVIENCSFDTLTIDKSVGDGDVSLVNVVVGKLLVNGGGPHSVTIDGGSVDEVVVDSDTGTRIAMGDDTTIGSVEIKETTTNGITLETTPGSSATVGEVSAAAPLSIKNTEVSSVTTSSTLNLNGSSVEVLETTGDAGASVTVNDTTLNKVEAGASSTTISGNSQVPKVETSGSLTTNVPVGEINASGSAVIVANSEVSNVTGSAESITLSDSGNTAVTADAASVSVSGESEPVISGSVQNVSVEANEEGSSGVTITSGSPTVTTSGSGSVGKVNVGGDAQPTINAEAKVDTVSVSDSASTTVTGTTGTIVSDSTGEVNASDASAQQVLATDASKVASSQTVETVSVTLESIAVTSLPVKTEYAVGGTLDTAGLVVTGYYTISGFDGVVSKAVTAYTCSPLDSATAGEKTITVTSVGKETAFTVTVAEKTVEKITVSTLPSVKTYDLSNGTPTLNVSGGKLTVSYTRSTLYPSETVELTTDMCSGFTAAEGLQTVTVTYAGKTAAYSVKVIDSAKDSFTLEKADAKAAFSSFVTDLLLNNIYSENGKTAVKAARDNGLAAIDSLTYPADKSRVASVLDEEKVKMEAVKTQDGEWTAAADDFKTAHSAILAKTVTDVEISDKAAVSAARSAYALLESGAQAKLTKQANLLDNLNSRIANLEASQTLDEAKDTAKTTLDKALTGYQSGYTKNYSTIAAAKADGNSAIDVAETVSAVSAALDNALAAMTACKSDAVLLNEARTVAIDVVNGYMPSGKHLSDYNANGKSQLSDLRSDAVAAINTAADDTAVTAALNDAKTAMDAVKTDAEMKAEAIAKAKADAKATLNAYGNPDDYRATQKTELITARSQGCTAIDAAADSAAVTRALNDAKAIIDAIKKDTQLTAEELVTAKTDAKDTLNTYGNPDDYRAAQKTELTAARSQGCTAIDAAADSAAVTKALNDAKAVIDAIKKDSQFTTVELTDSKTLVESAAFAAVTCSAVNTESAAMNHVLGIAQTAVNDSSITVTVNKVGFIAGVNCSTQAEGSDGTYTFTVSLSRGSVSVTTGTLTLSIAGVRHDYTATVTAPTCTEDGYTTHTCKHCDSSYQDTPVSKLNHDYKASYVWSAAENGYSCTGTAICQNNSGHVVTKTAVVSYAVITAPGCTTTGEGIYTASFSDSVFSNQTKTVELAATGHSYASEWSKDADYHWHAATCAHSNEVNDKAAHNWSVTENGTQRLYTCTVCGQTKTEDVPFQVNGIAYPTLETAITAASTAGKSQITVGEVSYQLYPDIELYGSYSTDTLTLPTGQHLVVKNGGSLTAATLNLGRSSSAEDLNDAGAVWIQAGASVNCGSVQYTGEGGVFVIGSTAADNHIELLGLVSTNTDTTGKINIVTIGEVRAEKALTVSDTAVDTLLNMGSLTAAAKLTANSTFLNFGSFTAEGSGALILNGKFHNIDGTYGPFAFGYADQGGKEKAEVHATLEAALAAAQAAGPKDEFDNYPTVEITGAYTVSDLTLDKYQQIDVLSGGSLTITGDLTLATSSYNGKMVDAGSITVYGGGALNYGGIRYTGTDGVFSFDQFDGNEDAYLRLSGLPKDCADLQHPTGIFLFIQGSMTLNNGKAYTITSALDNFIVSTDSVLTVAGNLVVSQDNGIENRDTILVPGTLTNNGEIYHNSFGLAGTIAVIDSGTLVNNAGALIQGKEVRDDQNKLVDFESAVTVDYGCTITNNGCIWDTVRLNEAVGADETGDKIVTVTAGSAVNVPANMSEAGMAVLSYEAITQSIAAIERAMTMDKYSVYVVSGNLTLSKDLTVPANKILRVPYGWTMDGVTTTSSMTLAQSATLTISANAALELFNSTTLNGDIVVAKDGRLTMGSYGDIVKTFTVNGSISDYGFFNLESGNGGKLLINGTVDVWNQMDLDGAVTVSDDAVLEAKSQGFININQNGSITVLYDGTLSTIIEDSSTYGLIYLGGSLTLNDGACTKNGAGNTLCLMRTGGTLTVGNLVTGSLLKTGYLVNTQAELDAALSDTESSLIQIESGNLSITGNTTMNGGLNLFGSNLSVDGNLTVNGFLHVGCDWQGNYSTLSVTGDLTEKGDMQVDGDNASGATVSITGKLIKGENTLVQLASAWDDNTGFQSYLCSFSAANVVSTKAGVNSLLTNGGSGYLTYFAGNGLYIDDSLTVTNNVTLEALDGGVHVELQNDLTINNGVTLTIGEGLEFRVNGRLNNNGTISSTGSFEFDGSQYSGSGSVYAYISIQDLARIISENFGSYPGLTAVDVEADSAACAAVITNWNSFVKDCGNHNNPESLAAVALLVKNGILTGSHDAYDTVDEALLKTIFHALTDAISADSAAKTAAHAGINGISLMNNMLRTYLYTNSQNSNDQWSRWQLDDITDALRDALKLYVKSVTTEEEFMAALQLPYVSEIRVTVSITLHGAYYKDGRFVSLTQPESSSDYNDSNSVYLCGAGENQDQWRELIVEPGATLTVDSGVKLDIQRGTKLRVEYDDKGTPDDGTDDVWGNLTVKGNVNVFGELDPDKNDKNRITVNSGAWISYFADTRWFGSRLRSIAGKYMTKTLSAGEQKTNSALPNWDDNGDFTVLVAYGLDPEVNGQDSWWQPDEPLRYGQMLTILLNVYKEAYSDATALPASVFAGDSSWTPNDTDILDNDTTETLLYRFRLVLPKENKADATQFALIRKLCDDSNCDGYQRDMHTFVNGSHDCEVFGQSFGNTVTIANDTTDTDENYGGRIDFVNCFFAEDITIYHNSAYNFDVYFDETCSFAPGVKIYVKRGANETDLQLLDGGFVQIQGENLPEINAAVTTKASAGSGSSFVLNGLTVSGTCTEHWGYTAEYTSICAKNHPDDFDWKQNDHSQCNGSITGEYRFLAGGNPAIADHTVLTVSGKTSDTCCIRFSGDVDISKLTANPGQEIDLVYQNGWWDDESNQGGTFPTKANIGANTVYICENGQFTVSGTTGTVQILDDAATVNDQNPHIFGLASGIYLNLTEAPTNVTLTAGGTTIPAENFDVTAVTEDGLVPKPGETAVKVHITMTDDATAWIDRDMYNVSMSFQVDGVTFAYAHVNTRPISLSEYRDMLLCELDSKKVDFAGYDNMDLSLTYGTARTIVENIWKAYNGNDELPGSVSLHWNEGPGPDDTLDYRNALELAERLYAALGVRKMTVSNEAELTKALSLPYVSEITIVGNMTLQGTADENDTNFTGCLYLDRPEYLNDSLKIYVQSGVTLTIGSASNTTKLDINDGVELILQSGATLTVSQSSCVNAFGGLDTQNGTVTDGSNISYMKRLGDFGASVYERLRNDGRIAELQASEKTNPSAVTDCWPENDWDLTGIGFLLKYTTAFAVVTEGDWSYWPTYNFASYGQVMTLLGQVYQKLTNNVMPASVGLDWNPDSKYVLNDRSLDQLLDTFLNALPPLELGASSYTLYHNGDDNKDYIARNGGANSDNMEVSNRKFTEAVTVTCTDDTFEGTNLYGGTIRFRNCVFTETITVYYSAAADFTVDFDDSCTFENGAQIYVVTEDISVLRCSTRELQLIGVKGADINAQAPCKANTGSENSFTFNGVTIIPTITGQGNESWVDVRMCYNCNGDHASGFDWASGDHCDCKLSGGVTVASMIPELQFNTGSNGSLSVSGTCTVDTVRVEGRANISALTAGRINLSDWNRHTKVNIGSNTVYLTDAQGKGYTVYGTGTVNVENNQAVLTLNDIPLGTPHVFNDSTIFVGASTIDNLTFTVKDGDAELTYTPTAYTETGPAGAGDTPTKYHLEFANNIINANNAGNIYLKIAVTDGCTAVYNPLFRKTN